MNDSSKNSDADLPNRGKPALDFDFELPVEPGHHETPPSGSFEAGYQLSLAALELVRNRPEIWEQRERRRCDVEFVL